MQLNVADCLTASVISIFGDFLFHVILGVSERPLFGIPPLFSLTSFNILPAGLSLLSGYWWFIEHRHSNKHLIIP